MRLLKRFRESFIGEAAAIRFCGLDVMFATMIGIAMGAGPAWLVIAIWLTSVLVMRNIQRRPL